MAGEIVREQELKVYTGTGNQVLAELNADLVSMRPRYIKQMGAFGGGTSTVIVWALWELEYVR